MRIVQLLHCQKAVATPFARDERNESTPAAFEAVIPNISQTSWGEGLFFANLLWFNTFHLKPFKYSFILSLLPHVSFLFRRHFHVPVFICTRQAMAAVTPLYWESLTKEWTWFFNDTSLGCIIWFSLAHEQMLSFYRAQHSIYDSPFLEPVWCSG